MAGHISEQREGDERPDVLGTVIPVVSDSLGIASDVPGRPRGGRQLHRLMNRTMRALDPHRDSGVPPLVELYHNERFNSESLGGEGKEKEEDSEEDLETIIFPPFPPRLPDPTFESKHYIQREGSLPPSFLNTSSCRTGNNHRATHLVTHQEPEPLERRDEPTRDGSEVSDEALVTRAQSIVVNTLRWLFQSFSPFRREAVTSSGTPR
uniref:Uncharacterized protein n=1 Tax=Timema poppense TaxID=170557 RepID=A0A7R9HEI7_TIMPO|nr:unnamed protein product [Timema poppensis]